MASFVSPKKAAAKRYSAGEASLYDRLGGRKYLNAGERHRLFRSAQALDRDHALFVLTLAWTGARVSEVLALTRSSFQLEAGLVTLVTLKRRRNCMREVPLPRHLLQGLDSHFGIRTAQGNEALAQVRLWPWHRSSAWRTIKGVMADAGVMGRPACPRGLRHGFGVGALQAGVPLNLVQRWLGHAQIRTTALYADAAGPEERALAARFWGIGEEAGLQMRNAG
jgi:integrase